MARRQTQGHLTLTDFAHQQDGQFLQHLLEELGHPAPLRMHSDSSAARAIVAPRGVGRLKHLAVCELWLQDELRAGHLQIEKVGTGANYADLFTKFFNAARHNVLTKIFGLRAEDDVS
eukprot:12530787-Heterocapsa_arctica.AAC.1